MPLIDLDSSITSRSTLGILISLVISSRNERAFLIRLTKYQNCIPIQYRYITDDKNLVEIYFLMGYLLPFVESSQVVSEAR